MELLQSEQMLNATTGGCNMPRQMLRWLDSLDLSFSVRNPRVDLANGFLVAEILSRYYPKDVSIYSFYNNQAKDKRINNWEQIQKGILFYTGDLQKSPSLLLSRINFRLDKEEYESVTNLAPNTALDLIYRLYQFLTKKKIKNDNRTIQVADEAPLYTKPTASYLAKDRQLQRIVDNNQKQSKTKKIIESHLTSIKNKKYTTGLIEWLIAKRKAQINQQLRRQEELLNKKTRSIGIQPKGQIKQIQLKCFNSSASRPGGSSKSKTVVDFLLDSMFMYLKKDYVMRDIRRLNLQLKQKDESVNVLAEIFKRCNEYEEQRQKVSATTLQYLIKQLNEPAEISLVFQNIHNNFIDFRKFFSLFIPALKTYNTSDNIYKLILQLVFKISSRLVEVDSQTTEMMFKELVLEDYMIICKQQIEKTHSICEIILSFTKPTTLNQYEMIARVKENLAQSHEYLTYLSYFISIILVTTGEIEENLWNQAYDHAITGLKSASSTTRTNSAKIISELVIFADESFFENFGPLAKLVEDDWWEVRALALVIYSRLIISKKKSLQETNESKDNSKQKNPRNYQIIFKQILIYILRMFHIGVDEKILRIGLIQLAQLLNYQKVLCSRYFEVLLSMDSAILADVLNRTQNRLGTVSDSKNTFEYRLTGAASEWDPVGISLALQDSIRENNLEQLTQKHLDILHSCLSRSSETKNKDVWLDIYQRLKSILFRALKDKEICTSAGSILKQFFTIQAIHKEVMGSSKEDLKQLLSAIYEQSQAAPQACILQLLKYFSQYNQEYMQYVYQTLKLFSEAEKDKYLGSNLVEFMNVLARSRRGKVFGI